MLKKNIETKSRCKNMNQTEFDYDCVNLSYNYGPEGALMSIFLRSNVW